MDDNLLRHELLHQFTQGLLENNFIPERVGIEVNSLVNSIPFSDNIKKDGIRAVKYLLAGGYFKYEQRRGTESVQITQKGLDAYYSEYFLNIRKEDRKKTINNRYTIAFGVITAFGVLFAILKDTILNEGTSKQQLKIIIESESKILPPVLIPKKTDSASIHVVLPLKKK